MSILDALPHTCDTYRRKRTGGVLGDSSDSFEAVSTGVACWRQPASAKEVEEFAKRGFEVTNKIYFVADPNLDERHTVVIGGRTYEVISVHEPDASAGLGIVWKVMVNRTTTGSTPA